MVYRVVSTKLTEEEHVKLLSICNKAGCTPSSLIKESIMRRINEEAIPKEKELAMEDLRRALKLRSEQKDKEKNISDSEVVKFLGIRN